MMKVTGEDALKQNIKETKDYINNHAGHKILSSSGTEMTTRSKLQFSGLNVSDKSDRTVVEGNLKVCATEAEWNALSDAEKNDPNVQWLLPWLVLDTDESMDYTYHATRRTRLDITSKMSNLPQAIAEQDLAKYGYAIGDYFTGASGYVYTLADLDTFYGGYDSYSVLSTHHICIVLDTKLNSEWYSGDATSVGYNGSTLHTLLKGTVLDKIKTDIATLTGDKWDSHLLSHQKLLSTGLSTWAWQTDQYISALTEVQIYGSNIWSANGYHTGEACKPLEVFQKYKFNQIFGSRWFWLRNMQSASVACAARHNGQATYDPVAGSGGVVGLIIFH